MLVALRKQQVLLEHISIKIAGRASKEIVQLNDFEMGNLDQEPLIFSTSKLVQNLNPTRKTTKQKKNKTNK